MGNGGQRLAGSIGMGRVDLMGLGQLDQYCLPSSKRAYDVRMKTDSVGGKIGISPLPGVNDPKARAGCLASGVGIDWNVNEEGTRDFH